MDEAAPAWCAGSGTSALELDVAASARHVLPTGRPRTLDITVPEAVCLPSLGIAMCLEPDICTPSLQVEHRSWLLDGSVGPVR